MKTIGIDEVYKQLRQAIETIGARSIRYDDKELYDDDFNLIAKFRTSENAKAAYDLIKCAPLLIDEIEDLTKQIETLQAKGRAI